MSRLELETPKAVTQNSRKTLANQCPSPHTQIATYRDGCPFRLIHSCLTPGHAVLYSGLCGSLHGYLLSCRRLLKALRLTRFPTLLFAIMHCCLFQRMRLLISLRLYSLPPNK